MELHAGLIVVVQNVAPALQRVLFQAALQYSHGRELINSVIEVSVQDNLVRCVEYGLPTDETSREQNQ